MSIKGLLADLAYESGITTSDGSSNYVETDAETLTDVIIDNHNTNSVSEVIYEQHHIEEAADELDAVADDADEMLDRERSYSAEAIKSVGRRYRMIASSYGLTSIGTSFESECSPEATLRSISSEARRASVNLRKGAAQIGDLSNEGSILDIFRSKDTKLKKARTVLVEELAKLKSNTDSLSKKAVAIKHKGIGKFLTKHRAPVSNLPKAIAEDVALLKGMDDFIKERLGWLKGVKETDTFKGGNDGSVNTVKSSGGRMLITSFKDNELPLMGNHFVTDFWKGSVPETSSYRVGGMLTGLLIVGASTALTGGIVNLAAIGVVAAGVSVPISEYRNTQGRGNVDFVDPAEIEKAVNQTLDLIKLQDNASVLKELETAKLNIDGNVKPNNNDLYKSCKGELDKVSSTLEIMKDHVYYLTVNLASLMERVNSAV